jgi:hypothetical protein
MKYQPYFYLGGLAIGAVAFVVASQTFLLVSIAFCIGVSIVQLLGGLKGYLPALAGGEKPAMEVSLVSILAILAQIVAVGALWCRFSFWETNPSVMRTGIYLYLPTLLIQLIQMRVSDTKAMYAYYQQLLAISLVTASVLFLFFLTPEKRLANRLYASEPEKLQKVLADIELRTPKKPAKKVVKED